MMDTPWVTVIGLFCVAPLILFWGGFALGRWTKGLKIIRADQVSEDVQSTRYAPASRKIRPVASNDPTQL